MKSAIVAALCVFTAAPAFAQTAPPPLKTYAASAEVRALIAQAKAQRKEGQALVSLPLLRMTPYQARLDYRASLGPANQHPTEMELFYVLEGSATLAIGGELVEPRPANGPNLNGASVRGGQAQSIAAGDILMVPPNTPHWFSAVDRLVVISLHTPAPAAP